MEKHLASSKRPYVPMEQRIAEIKEAYGRPADEVVNDLWNKSKNWDVVARELNTNRDGLRYLRRTLGMTSRPYVPMEQRIAEIKEVYGGSANEVINDFRDVEKRIDGGNGWSTVAGCFDMGRRQLFRLRKDLGIPPDGKVIRSPATRGPTPTDIKAVSLGYEDGEDCVRALRLQEKLTIAQGAAKLEISVETFRQHTPLGLKGVYNLSYEGRGVLVKIGKIVGGHPKASHPWKQKKGVPF